jgi:hypothetical protein
MCLCLGGGGQYVSAIGYDTVAMEPSYCFKRTSVKFGTSNILTEVIGGFLRNPKYLRGCHDHFVPRAIQAISLVRPYHSELYDLQH